MKLVCSDNFHLMNFEQFLNKFIGIVPYSFNAIIKTIYQYSFLIIAFCENQLKSIAIFKFKHKMAIPS